MANKENLAAWLHGVDDLRVQPFPAATKPLKGNHVRVQIGAVGICGSDVHYLKHMKIGDFVVKEPMVIGHESAGIVIETGPDVGEGGLKIGDRVALEPGVPCRCCSLCKCGTYNLCEDMAFFATPPIHGSLAQVVSHPADFCHKLPSSMTLEEGAMCEPVSVAVHACERAGVAFGHKVAILGAGPIGLVTMMVCKAFGATATVVTDIANERLDTCKQLGATAVLNVKSLDPTATATEVARLLGGNKPDVVIDCVGMESSMQTSMVAAKSGGKVCLVGMGHSEMLLPMTGTAVREVDILGVFRYRNAYPTAIELIRSGAIDVQPLITHRYDLTPEGGGGFSEKTVVEGFEKSAEGRDAIKVMFTLHNEEKGKVVG